MSKRFNNKRLIYLLAGLIGLLILTFILKIPNENATLISKIVEFDTTEVSKIILYPKGSIDSPVEFRKSGDKWSVQQGLLVSATKKDAVAEIFSEVMNLKPQMLAAASKAKWEEFELTDSLATRIKFLDKSGKNLADLMIGKVSYKQVNDPYGRNNFQGTSYVRLNKEKEIYGVEGFISFFFSGRFNDWRDKTFLDLKYDDITKLEFSYPGDSSFILDKKETAWFAGNIIADSLKVSGFLKSLSQMDGQEIKDGFKPVVSPDYQVLIEGNNLLSVSVKCYKGDNSDEYILNSGLNPDVFFSSRKNGLFEKVFKAKENFYSK